MYVAYASFSVYGYISCIPYDFPANFTLLHDAIAACVAHSPSDDDTVAGLLQCVFTLLCFSHSFAHAYIALIPSHCAQPVTLSRRSLPPLLAPADLLLSSPRVSIGFPQQVGCPRHPSSALGFPALVIAIFQRFGFGLLCIPLFCHSSGHFCPSNLH